MKYFLLLSIVFFAANAFSQDYSCPACEQGREQAEQAEQAREQENQEAAREQAQRQEEENQNARSPGEQLYDCAQTASCDGAFRPKY